MPPFADSSLYTPNMILADPSALSQEEWRTHVAVENIATAAAVLFVWEYLVTWKRERKLFWTGLFRRMDGVGVLERRVEQALFFVNRYVTPLSYVPVMWIWFWDTTGVSEGRIEQVCHHLHRYHEILVVIVQLYVAIMMSLRISRLYRLRPCTEPTSRVRNLIFSLKGVIVLCSGFILVAVAVGVWAILSSTSTESTSYYSPTGCPVIISQSKANRYAIAWSGLTAFDVLAMGLTFYYTRIRFNVDMNAPAISSANAAPPNPVIQDLDTDLRSNTQVAMKSFFDALLRDGSIFFGVLVACNVSTIFTYVYGEAFIKGSPAIFTNVLSSVVITRLFFQMQDELNDLRSGINDPNGLRISPPGTDIRFGLPPVSIDDRNQVGPSRRTLPLVNPSSQGSSRIEAYELQPIQK